MTKYSKQRSSADIGLIFIAYNLKRIWNILKQAKAAQPESFKAFIIYSKTILGLLETLNTEKPEIVSPPRF